MIFGKKRLIILGGVVLLFALLACSQNAEKPAFVFTPDTVVLAFGESLTAGMGAKIGESYPERLAELLGARVINAGISGEVSSAGLRRLPSLLAAHKPEVVIICHGANDILRRYDLAAAKTNVGAMIRLAQESGAVVVLIGVPKLNGIFIETADFYDELAKELNVLYDDKIISKIIKDPALKSDQIHPNKDGYLLIAKTVRTLLVR